MNSFAHHNSSEKESYHIYTGLPIDPFIFYTQHLFPIYFLGTTYIYIQTQEN